MIWSVYLWRLYERQVSVMFNFVKAELLKQKHRFSIKLLWIAPILTVLLVVAMMAGSHVQNGAYNWWYTILLPGSFTLFITLHTSGERRKNRHGFFGIVIEKKRLWISQVIFYVGYLLATCFVFFLATTLGGFVFGASLSHLQNALASFVLFLTFAWQIPLWMAVTEKMGKFIPVLLSLLCNCGLAVIWAVKEVWWIPFSIPARLMCPLIGVLPNGLAVEANSNLMSESVILPGIIITVGLFFATTWLTSFWFEKREV